MCACRPTGEAFVGFFFVLDSLWGLTEKVGESKTSTFLGCDPPQLSLEHWPLWLAGGAVTLPRSLSTGIPVNASGEKTAAQIRDAQMGEILMTDSFLPPHLWRGHCARRTQWGYTLQEGVNTDSVKQTKTSFVPRRRPGFFFLAAHLFNFLRGRRGLPYLGLFIPANRPVAFCLQVTHPEVTFNSWTKSVCCHALWHSPLSLRRLLIQWRQQSCIHGP